MTFAWKHGMQHSLNMLSTTILAKNPGHELEKVDLIDALDL